MDDRKAYTALSIPQRTAAPPAPEERGGSDAPPDGAAAAVGVDSGAAREKNAAVGSDTGADPRFAEIEINTYLNCSKDYEAALRFFTSLTPAQPIEQRAVDPIRQRFFDMRSLVSDRPFARDDSELFYKQAKFMEDFEDDYGGDAKLNMYFPYYQHMGYEQLRTYFTWRTRVRRGEISSTYVSYVFLYIYELLSGVGTDGPLDGLGKLVEIWETMSGASPALEKYLPGWLKDYHVYYKLPHSFENFVKRYGMQKHYPEFYLFSDDVENALDIWNSVSNYNVTGSVYYKAGNEQLMADCLKYVIAGIKGLLSSKKVEFKKAFVYQFSRRGIWYPFSQALFYPKGRQADRQVELLGVERYQCKDNRWSALLPIYYSGREQIVGRILRKMESCLRQTFNYKYKLKAEPCAFYRSSGTPIVFDEAIEKAVADFHRDITRTVVTVDKKNLARIREEALGTQDKLIVPEGPEHSDQRAARTPVPSVAANSVRHPPADFVPGRPPVPSVAANSVRHPPADSPWSALRDALNPVELQALSIALTGVVDIKTFADENGIMLEVLADGINEKAADFIGDNILEVSDGMIIYDDYLKHIEVMTGAVKNTHLEN